MRAFMSQGARLLVAVPPYERTLAVLAVREARAILAETEPFEPSRDEFRVGRTSNSEHSSIGLLAMCSPMYQALAEALAAFVAEGE